TTRTATSSASSSAARAADPAQLLGAGESDGQLALTAANKFCAAVRTPSSAVRTAATVVVPGLLASCWIAVCRVVSDARSAVISSCHSVRALPTSVLSEVCTAARSLRSSVTTFGPTVIVTSRLTEASRSAASAHSSGLAVDEEAGVDGADVAGDGAGVGVPAPPPLSLDPQPARRSPVASRTAAQRVLMPASVTPPPSPVFTRHG